MSDQSWSQNVFGKQCISKGKNKQVYEFCTEHPSGPWSTEQPNSHCRLNPFQSTTFCKSPLTPNFLFFCLFVCLCWSFISDCSLMWFKYFPLFAYYWNMLSQEKSLQHWNCLFLLALQITVFNEQLIYFFPLEVLKKLKRKPRLWVVIRRD